MGKSTYLIKYVMLGGILYSAIITVYPNGLHAETKPRGIRLLSDINTISFTVENEGSPKTNFTTIRHNIAPIHPLTITMFPLVLWTTEYPKLLPPLM